MDFLEPAIKPFLQRSQKQHKIELYSNFIKMQRNLPAARGEDDADGWRCLDSFRQFFAVQQKKSRGALNNDTEFLDEEIEYAEDDTPEEKSVDTKVNKRNTRSTMPNVSTAYTSNLSRHL